MYLTSKLVAYLKYIISPTITLATRSMKLHVGAIKSMDSPILFVER